MPQKTLKRGVSNNAFASGSNPNAGNFITDRSSTRVHAPPGGKTSISLFGPDDSNVSTTSKKSNSDATAFLSKPKETSQSSANSSNTNMPQKTLKRGVSNNAFASGSNPNAGNFITDRSSTRVH